MPEDRYLRTFLKCLDFFPGCVPLLLNDFTFLRVLHSSCNLIQAPLLVQGIFTFPSMTSSTVTCCTTDFISSATNLHTEHLSEDGQGTGLRLAKSDTRLVEPGIWLTSASYLDVEEMKVDILALMENSPFFSLFAASTQGLLSVRI